MTDRNSLDLFLTKDGSSTLFSNQFGQYYHNPNGAVSENIYIFFEISGLYKTLTSGKPITIFEVGFGTGLNLLLLLDACLSSNFSSPMHFYSCEAFPVSEDIAKSFNFSDFLEHPELSLLLPDIFGKIEPGINSIRLHPEKPFYLHLFYGKFSEVNTIAQKADFIFHDAFSPEKNGELWTVAAFTKLLAFSHYNTILTTYCSASKARAAMAIAEWKIARVRGTLGKREMTIASPNPDKLFEFKHLNEEKLIWRYQNGDFK